MKTDSRPRARFFCGNARSSSRLQTKQLLKTQRVGEVVIIGAMPAEEAVAGFFITRNCPCIVFVDFKPQGPPLSALGCLLRRRQQKRPDAAPTDMGGDGDGIKPGHAGARRKQDQCVAGQSAARFGDDQRGARRAEKMAQATPRQHANRKDRLFERDQRVEIAHPAAAQPGGNDRVTAAPAHDMRSCSIRAIIVSSRSSRSASPGGLSQRSRLTRGNRIASPDLCRVERCSPSKATSSTRP